MKKTKKKTSWTRWTYLLLGIRVTCIVILILLAAIWFDAGNDLMVCKSEFEKISGLEADFYYANYDYWRLNFGGDISCIVYWSEELPYLAFIDFKSGTLTPQMIESMRYWDD